MPHMQRTESILEIGANVGINLRALRRLTAARLAGVEPNASARALLAECADDVFDGIAAAIPAADASFDLVFTSGVLIHIPPSELLASCKEIERVSRRYIVAVEYFARDLEAKQYRGHDALWKRDFGAYWLDHFPLRPVACGFAWSRLTGLDDLTWWVLEKL